MPELVLNDAGGAASNLASLRMLEDEKKEYASALAWMVSRDMEEGDDIAKEVWNAPLSRAAKHLILGAALREQERRDRAKANKN